MKKLYKLLFAFALFFTTVNIPNVSAEEEGNLGNIFTNVKLSKGEPGNLEEIDSSEEIIVDENSKFWLVLDWEIENGFELEAGNFAELDLPEAFMMVSSSGKLNAFVEGEGDDLIEVGTYTISDGKLRFLFNERLVGKIDRNGELGLNFEFDLKKLDENLELKLEDLGGSKKDYNFKYSPDNDKEVIKDGEVIRRTIEYTVDINTNFKNLTEAKFIDTLPDSLKLVDGSVEIYKLNYDVSTGKYVETANNIVDSFTLDTTAGIKIDLKDIKSAYRVKYKADIVAFPEEGYENTAQLTFEGGFVEDTHKIGPIKQEPLLDKSGYHNSNSKEIIWTIDVNKAGSKLTGAKLEDIIPDGLEFDSLEVYKIEYENVNGQNKWVQKDKVNYPNELPIEFGDIDSAYRVFVKTTIDPKVIYPNGRDKEFVNTAILKSDEYADIEDSATVKVDFDELVSKAGEDVTNFGDREMEWTVTFNKAGFNIYNAKFVDAIGPGQELIEDSILINGKTLIELNLELVTDENKILNNDWYLDISDIENDTLFGVALGHINEEFTVTYRTKINPTTDDNGNEKYEDEYKNRAFLFGSFTEGELGTGSGGSGIDEGNAGADNKVRPLEEHGTTGKLSVKNSFSKSTVHNGINYADKTFEWVVTATARASAFTELTISDTFTKEMVLLPETIRVYKYLNGSGDGQLLVEGTDYTLSTEDYKFDLVFNSNVLDKSEYRVYFKTTFDTNTVGLDNWPADNEFVNNVDFNGKNKETDFVEKRDAKYELDNDIFNHGKKVGTLNRNERTIAWEVYANALGYEFNEEVIISDTLSAGQSINKDTMKVYKYTLNSNGSITKGEEVSSGFEIAYNEDAEVVNEFTATFASGLDYPVLFEFDTEILGISNERYENEVVVESGDYERKYSDDVYYNDHDKFVNKGSDVSGNTVYQDNEINWTVTVNESLSHIKLAVFKDTISDGLLLITNSIKVNGNPVSSDDLTIVVDDNNPGNPTELTIELGEIEGIVTVTYTTLVVKGTGKVSNSARLLSGEEQLGESSGKEYTATVSSWGTGSGKERHGSIEIVKVDEFGNTITNLKAEFELYYLVNEDTKIYVGNKTHETVNGKLQFANLPYRTYYLREVNAPEGFILDDEVVKIELNSKDLTLDIENKYERINVSANKEWVDGPEDDRPVIYFELYRNVAGENATAVTDAELKKVDDSNIVKWTGLERTNIDGIEYTYSVKEVDEDGKDYTPANYAKDEKGLTVKNQYQIPDIEVEATKEWVTAKELDEFPTVFFKLYRQLPGGEVEEVDADILEVDADTNTAIWHELEKTDINGVEYIYSVVEVDEEGNDYVPLDFSKEEEGLLVVNTYDPRTSFSVEKVWENGDLLARPDVTVNLHQNGEVYETVTLNDDNNWFHVFEDLPVIDVDGNDYEYDVDEVDVENYGKAIEYYESDRHYVITNTYDSDVTDLTVFKVWKNGPEVKPDIELQLFRNGEEYLEAVALVNGEFSHTFKDLEVTDEDGKAYEYYVLEVSENELYEVEYDENTIINTYVSPTTTLEAEKVWKNAPKFKPTIAFQLYQNGEAYGDPVVLKNTTEVIWENVPITDEKGNEYVYTVDEVSTPKNYSKSVDGMVITNTYVKVPGTGISSNAYYYLAILVVAIVILVLNTYPYIKRKYNK